MQRERVADDIYVFTSDVYAQVTAGAVITSDGAILIDTLLFPEETRSIRLFVEGRLGSPVKYVINTHYHADHTYGTCLFPGATVISHSRCYDLLDSRGRPGLEKAQIGMPELNGVQVVLPHLVFDHKVMNLHLGNRTIQMWHTPGHSPDSIVCLVKEDRVLFAGDTLMPVPYFVDGDYEDLVRSLRSLQGNSFENIVQGHGEVILRGEIEARIQSDLHYLTAVRRYVETARSKADPIRYLNHIDIERCGKSRIPLSGSVQQLHHANLRALYRQITGQPVEESAPQSSYETPDR